MSKKEWGNCTWKTAHHFAMAYPCEPTAQDKRQMKTWITSLCHNLPCEECQGHCKTYVASNPPDVTSSCSLQAWWFEFHNAVNKRLKKPVFTAAQYQKRYGTAVKVHRENRKKSGKK